MKSIRVAGAQLPVTRDVRANERHILDALEYARREGADVLLTPEGSLSGYTPEFDRAAVAEALERVVLRAREVSVGLALGTCFVEPEDGRCYNQVRFYSPGGEYLGFQSKTLLCGTLDALPKGEITRYGTAPLRTFELCGIRVGGLICNDMWANPACTPSPDVHLSQRLSDMGARIIFHAVNGGRDASEWSALVWRFHESNLRIRARAGNVWMVVADNCHPPAWPCSCPCGVITPEGAWACRTEPKSRQYFVHTIEIGE